jgi:hypothetical protein
MKIEPDDAKLLAASVKRTAILVIAVRRLAWAHHRDHATRHDPTWANCTHQWCKFAHAAIEGKLMLGNTTASGKVVALVKKEA